MWEDGNIGDFLFVTWASVPRFSDHQLKKLLRKKELLWKQKKWCEFLLLRFSTCLCIPHNGITSQKFIRSKEKSMQLFTNTYPWKEGEGWKLDWTAYSLISGFSKQEHWQNFTDFQSKHSGQRLRMTGFLVLLALLYLARWETRGCISCIKIVRHARCVNSSIFSLT